MKTNYTLIIISGVMLFCYACTKNGVPVANKSKTLDTAFTTIPITASIIGKWYVNKQRVQVLTASTGAITDTTYSGTTFNTDFYYQFNSDSTATFTQGTIFFTSSAITVNGSIQTITRLIFIYNVTGSILTVKYKFYFPMASNTNPGPYPLTIVQLNANTLVLHGINSTANGSLKTVLDIYLTRGQ
jgi:hypothetical protein